jgi:hypothetical protein
MSTVVKSDKRKELDRLLFLATQCVVVGKYRNDVEYVKEVRNSWALDMYGRFPKDLKDHEVQMLIERLNKNGMMDAPKSYSTTEQRRLYNYYAITTALAYANFQEIQVHDQDTGDMYTGEHARSICKLLFDRSRPMPQIIVRQLFSEWINPKSHRFLLEGGFKDKVLNPSTIYLERLTKEEMNYLINRYMKIHNELQLKKATANKANLN